MLKKKLLGLLPLIGAVILAITLAGCPTTKKNVQNTGDEIGSSAVDAGTDAVKDNVNKEIRKGVDSLFGR